MENVYGELIDRTAATYGLDAGLLTAQVTVESGGHPWAWNPEPKYRYFWDVRHGRPFRSLSAQEIFSEVPPNDFPSLAGDRDQEWWAQQASWGLLQVLGAVAREDGFLGPYLTELCDPSRGLEIGARHLKGLLDWSHQNYRQALGAYNAGRGNWSSTVGRAYAEKVFTTAGRTA